MLLHLLLSVLPVVGVALTVTGLVLIGYTLYIIWIRRQYSHLPTPPYRSFYMGHAKELNDGDRTGSVHLIFIRWAKICGPVFYFTILHKVMLLVNTPELAKQVLMNSKYKKAKSLYKRTQSVAGIRFLGKGLATNFEHKDWKAKRQAINPAFHSSNFDKLTTVFNDAGDRLIKELKDISRGGQLISVLDQMHKTTLDVIGQAAFSEDILNTDGGIFTRAVYLSLKLMTLEFRNPLFKWLPWNISFLTEARKNAVYVRNRARTILNTRIQRISEGQETPVDILDVMVRTMVGRYPLEDIVDEVVTMFIAGHETTANVISFFILELGRNPSVQRKVREEIDSLVESKSFISQEDVGRLDWTTASLKETLRLFPPTGFTPRDTPDRVEVLAGYEIPPRSIVLVNFFAIHYLSVKDGYSFRPERFLADSETITREGFLSSLCDPDLIPGKFSQLAFSLGQRSCIARNFFFLESKILLVKLFQNFTYEIDPEDTFDVENAGTFKPAGGAKVFLYKR